MCSAVQLCSDLCSHRCFWRFTERLTRQQPTNNGNQRRGWLPSTGFFLNPSFSEAYKEAQRKVPVLRYIKDWVRVQNTRPQIIIFILTLSNDYHAQGVSWRCARGLAFTTQWIMRERMRTLLTCNHWRSHDPPLWPALAALVPLTSRRYT